MKYKKSVGAVLTAGLLVFGATQTFAEKKMFSDVEDNAWYAESVQKLSEFNIIGGFEDQTFKPDQNITRAQTASIIAKALNLDLTNVSNPGFKDVPTTSSHYPAIAALTEKGVFSSGEYFNPGDSLTRAQMAKILVIAFDLNSSQLKTFDDVNEKDWFYEFSGKLGALGITTNESKYNPQDYVGRAHLAAFIKRTIDYKRSDSIDDIWDTWQGWDNTEVPDTVKEPVEENDGDNDVIDEEETGGKEEVDEAKLKEYERELDNAANDIKSAQKKVEKALDELEEAKEDDEEEIEEAEKDLLKVLSDLDDAIIKGEATLEKIRKVNLKELNLLQSVLENAIRKAKNDVDKAYANTFDKELYEEEIDDALEALEDAREDAERAIKENSLNLLQDAYKALETAIEEAEKTFEMYEDSTVDVLEDEEKELEEAIEEAKDLFDEVGDLLEKKAEDQIDYFKDLLDDAIDALDDALDEEDKGDIYDAREKLEKVIKDAQKALDRLEKIDMDALIGEIEELEKAISDAEEELEDSK
ncbi:S-layer homology domain-containing protein [Lysinibacillus telephonicus]|uniref:S-layer homology domain-containing protein n=1 Tax=Lysinibacillus telephonicus TaxID=1714840 RepID=UPI00397A20C2